ncbi:helix-turn-helix domain-containing protein [Marinobacter adhaerens]|uniref:Helix-turn-helix domain-containing protein n=1 Tax=Marinobacter adhaerens TaxID=1033846 RepID=A0A851HTR4_9GAMM|nr:MULTISPECIES: helix-turn-helix domain-containing protein [Marinobacter]NWN90672.1 helix-turn-helix domain-containing protein [Marinobacter adhaerens]
MSEKIYTVGQLAAHTDIKSVTIRYYEKIGLLPEATRSESGYRLYSEADHLRLLFIRRSRRLGFSLDDIRELLSLADRQQESCAGVDAKVEQQLEQVRSRLKDLHAMEKELERLSACCEGGVIMDCRIIDTLSGET